MKNVTGVAIIGLLSALAVTGWMQKPAQVAYPGTAASYASGAPFYPQQVMAQVPAGAYMAQPDVASAPARIQTVADRRYDSRYDRRGPSRQYHESSRGSYGDRYSSRDRYSYGDRYDDRYYREDRPFSHSAAIVGGGAAAGAAIGGLAKGGKGAAVGALAGGAAGLIYDRMTHRNARW